MFGPALVGVGVVVGLYLVGRAIGAAGNPTTVTVGTNNTESTDCGVLCSQWDARRQERCNAEADQRTAQARVDGLRASMLTVLGAATSLAVAAAAAAAIPFFGTAIAAALAAAAAVMFALALVLAGQLGAAEVDLAGKAKAAQDARTAEAAARALLASGCSPQQADACLMRPSPC